MGGRRNSYGYSEYHGRGGGRIRTMLLFIIALLAVILIAGVVFYMAVELEYTEDGVKIHLPWAQESAAPPPIASDPLEVVSDPLDVTVEPTLEAEPSAAVQYAPIGAITVTVDDLRGGGAGRIAASAGGTALVVEMKDRYGNLAWKSQAATADLLGINADDDVAAQAVRTLAQTTDLYLVARVNCFRDPVLARNRMGSLMTKGGNVWYDRLGLGWASPASQQAADYVSALCLELADMGFDEIVLECAGYPSTGEVNVLATSENRPENLTVPVSAFLERVSGELKERNVCLSVYTDQSLTPEETVLSGLTAEVLARYAGRIWLDSSVSAEQYSALLSAAGWEDSAPRLVVKNAFTGAGSWYT